ncbi:hypothetical protein [Paenisporosarcina sp. TG20]|uniref:hypothetical protein n=1 Tax=Paenisporosarcina sp. TG20 TaxID=1211706 RepID=UPI0002F9334C|nr:hypothetical protein [Paenisporosarcina sp. TG20]
MYDPTVFENLKVAFENAVYDLDNIGKKISITNRVDRMDFSVLARYFAIKFTLVDKPGITAEIILEATLKELAAEILEEPGKNPGCTMILRFYKQIQNVTKQCKQIDQALKDVWEPNLLLTQTLSFMYEQKSANYTDSIEITFDHKIKEEHIDDISDFLEHVLETLKVLNDMENK